jgi:hypothetical protein
MTIVITCELILLLLHVRIPGRSAKGVQTTSSSRSTSSEEKPGSGVTLGGKLRALLSRSCFTALLLLYPIVCNSALKLVDCQSVAVSAQGYLSLDHGLGSSPFATGAAADRNAVVKLQVLSDNPFYVCYAGSHAPAGYLAWLTLVVYVIGYPVTSMWFVARRIRAIASRDSKLQAADRPDKAKSAAFKWNAPTWLPVPFRFPAALDTAEAIISNPTLAPFTAGDYRPSTYWFRHVDMAVMLMLSLLLVFWARPTTSADIIGKAMLSIVTAAGLLVMLWRLRPYPAKATWKLRVRTYSLALTMLAAIVNCLTALTDLDPTSQRPLMQQALFALSVLLVIGCAGLLVTLVVSFAWDMVRGAKQEQAAIVAVRTSLVPLTSQKQDRQSQLESKSGDANIVSRAEASTPDVESPPHRLTTSSQSRKRTVVRVMDSDFVANPVFDPDTMSLSTSNVKDSGAASSSRVRIALPSPC